MAIKNLASTPKDLFVAIIFAASTFAMSGCAYGIIYTSTTEPLVTNMRATQLGDSTAKSGTRQVSLPVTALSLSAGWKGRGIGEAAQQAGLTEIYYADLHTLSILLGLYQQKTVLVY